ncbi:type II toxin-antitoxin system VapC family toxin [Synechococcus sp. PCC 7336]|uniref:type II toxin-antitoxin system VapC family toxin n=1 Tax=Synechococcus sp. PCC 7336 TaxID=195250 RepID=UPI001930B1DC|nr:type II toxin-antitoxin system VapC family toxin [Synechococcus sp. PCC 7336]
MAELNVVSELRKPRPHRLVVEWLQFVDDAKLFLSAVTLGEIQAGIEVTREQDRAKAAEIKTWLELVAVTYNVLSMDAATFRSWARLMHRKSDTLYEDAMIAATAGVHNLIVVTRNVADFKVLDVEILNPFEPVGH